MSEHATTQAVIKSVVCFDPYATKNKLNEDRPRDVLSRNVSTNLLKSRRGYLQKRSFPNTSIMTSQQQPFTNSVYFDTLSVKDYTNRPFLEANGEDQI